MGKSADSFGSQLRQWDTDLVKKASAHCTGIAVQAYRDLVQRAADVGGEYGSPVASGRLAASFRVSLNQADTSFAAPDPGYRYPSRAIHRGNANNLPGRTIRNRPLSEVSLKLKSFKLGDTIYISNSVPYIRRIEVGGHSWQTPGGIFAPTMRKIIKQFSGVSIGRL